MPSASSFCFKVLSSIRTQGRTQRYFFDVIDPDFPLFYTLQKHTRFHVVGIRELVKQGKTRHVVCFA